VRCLRRALRGGIISAACKTKCFDAYLVMGGREAFENLDEVDQVIGSVQH
jgi:hypothetical protein